MKKVVPSAEVSACKPPNSQEQRFVRAMLALGVLLVPSSLLGVCGSAFEMKLTASDAGTDHLFGGAVAVSEDLAVVSGPRKLTLFQEGVVYVFRCVAGSWIEEARLTASDGSPQNFFGDEVAIQNDTIVVSSRTSIDPEPLYIFKWNGSQWNEDQILTASDTAFDNGFGQSLAIDGNTLVVGAPDSFHSPGAVYVFEYDGVIWIEQQKLTPSDAPQGLGRHFGMSVDIDGDTLVVGARGDKQSTVPRAVYVFENDGQNWVEQDKLQTAAGILNHGFAESVSIEGNFIVAGASFDDEGGNQAGAAYVFARSSGVWNETQKLLASNATSSAAFGKPVDMYEDLLVIGAQLHRNAGETQDGAAYIFMLRGETWIEESQIDASDGALLDSFGSSVSIQGSNAVIGAPNKDDAGNSSGAAYIYNLRRADLVLTADASPDPVIAGTTMEYTVTVVNSGSEDATDVVAADMLPAEVTLENTNGCVEDPVGVPECTIGTLPPGAEHQYTISVAVPPSARGILSNQATASSTALESNPGDESATVQTTIDAIVDLEVTVSDLSGPYFVGDQIVYIFTISNNGPSSATDVSFTHQLPLNTTFDSVFPDFVCAEDAGLVSCLLENLSSSQSIIVFLEAAEIGQSTTSASVSGTEFDPDTLNNIVPVNLAILDQLIFVDGFESGDTSVWSSSAP